MTQDLKSCNLITLTNKLATRPDQYRLCVVLPRAAQREAGQLLVANRHLPFPPAAVVIVIEDCAQVLWHSFSTARAEDASFRHTEMEGTMMIGYLH